MHEKKLADDHGNGHQPKNKPRKGPVQEEIASPAQSVKPGGDRRSAKAVPRIYRCETSGRVATVREHTDALCAEFTRASAETVTAAIYKWGTWYGRRFTFISGSTPPVTSLSGRMRALLAAAPAREVWMENDFAAQLAVKPYRIRHAARALLGAGEIERVKPFTYRVLRKPEVAHVS